MPIQRPITDPGCPEILRMGDSLTAPKFNELSNAINWLNRAGRLAASGHGFSHNKDKIPYNGDHGNSFTESASIARTIYFEFDERFTNWAIHARVRTRLIVGNEQNVGWSLNVNSHTQTLTQIYHTSAPAGTNNHNTGTTGDYWILDFGTLDSQFFTFPTTKTELAALTIASAKSTPGSPAGLGLNYWDGVWDFSFYLYA